MLDRALLKSGAVAFVMIGSSENADMRYTTRFTTTDPVMYIKKRGSRGFIIVSQMEYKRATRESAVGVMSRSEAGLIRILDREKDRWRAYALMIHDLIQGPILVPPDLPFAIGKHLSEMTDVYIDQGSIQTMRAQKKKTEIAEILKVQKATEAAMKKAVMMISHSKPKKGVLYLNQKPLTSEMIRDAMNQNLLKHGCSAHETIVSCGKDTAIPHVIGNGPLFSHEPIVIDIFPRSDISGFFTDMTRTISKGDPSTEIVEMFHAVKEAQDIAASLLKPGTNGSDVHQKVMDFFNDRGFRSGTEGGFTHNLGHGVGLEVHELPVIGPSGGKLKRGNVVTNEPGLYYPDIGGVRLENIGVISRIGIECLTRFPRELVL